MRKSKVKDDEVVKAVEEMKRTEVKMLRDEEWKEVNGIMYKEGKVYVPKFYPRETIDAYISGFYYKTAFSTGI